jgi:hypothetical protein
MDSQELTSLDQQWGEVQLQEMRLVAAGLKPACRIGVRRAQLPALSDTLNRLSLKMVVGYDAIFSQPVPGRQGYSEWCQRMPAIPDSEERCYAYIAPDRFLGQRLRRLDEALNDWQVGEVLGYPQCCIKAFCEPDEADEKGRDPVLIRYPDDSPISWYLNVSLLCFGFSLLTHIPCNPHCEGSMEMAQTYFTCLSAQQPAVAEKLRQMLCNRVIHTQTLGVLAFIADEYREPSSSLEVKDIVMSQSDSILNSIVKINSLITFDTQGISVDGCYFSKRQMKLFRYC